MKIIATTEKGYLVEINPQEVGQLTGVSDHVEYHNRRFKPGQEFAISDTWSHLRRLLENEKERQRIAESLRAAATLIEHTPSPITLPAESQPA